MTYHHVDRFDAAVRILAGDGNVKQRLMRAFQENLEAIAEDELPGSIKGDFSALRNRMTRENAANGEGRICASVRKMSAKEASSCAASVVSLYGEMIRSAQLMPEQEQDKGVVEAVPPFLVKSVS